MGSSFKERKYLGGSLTAGGGQKDVGVKDSGR